MADIHAVHRPYLAAIADGELDLVPETTRDHVRNCSECTFELKTHMLLGSRLRDAARAEKVRPPARRFGFVPLAAAAAVLLAVVGVALAGRTAAPAVPVPVAAAVDVAGQQPSYLSTNAADVAAWCTARYGNRVPRVAVAGMEPVGARMDWPNGIGVATVTYRLDGKTVHVSWLAQPIGGSAPSELTVNGERAVVVRVNTLTAVVTGVASDSQLVEVAREVAASE